MSVFATVVLDDSPGAVTDEFVFTRTNTNGATFGIRVDAQTDKWQAQVRLTGSVATPRIISSDDVAETGVLVTLAVVYDGATLRLWVDGVLQADTDSNAGTLDQANPTGLHIGNHDTGDNAFDGSIFVVGAWNGPLTSLGIAGRSSDPLRMFRRRSAPIWKAPAPAVGMPGLLLKEANLGLSLIGGLIHGAT
jgi:hypothetical protein